MSTHLIILTRLGICQIFYTRKIKKFLNFTREKRVIHDIFGQTETFSAVILKNLTKAQKCFEQVSLVPLVTNFMSDPNT